MSSKAELDSFLSRLDAIPGVFPSEAEHKATPKPEYAVPVNPITALLDECVELTTKVRASSPELGDIGYDGSRPVLIRKHGATVDSVLSLMIADSIHQYSLGAKKTNIETDSIEDNEATEEASTPRAVESDNEAAPGKEDETSQLADGELPAKLVERLPSLIEKDMRTLLSRLRLVVDDKDPIALLAVFEPKQMVGWAGKVTEKRIEAMLAFLEEKGLVQPRRALYQTGSHKSDKTLWTAEGWGVYDHAELVIASQRIESDEKEEAVYDSLRDAKVAGVRVAFFAVRSDATKEAIKAAPLVELGDTSVARFVEFAAAGTNLDYYKKTKKVASAAEKGRKLGKIFLNTSRAKGS